MSHWTEQYQMFKQLDGDDIWLVVMPLTLGRARLAVADWSGPFEFW